jgi:hypothetical protein
VKAKNSYYLPNPLKMRKYFIYLLPVFFLSACYTPNRVVKFTPKQRDVFTNGHLKTFLSSNSHPNIVLRVPNTYEQVTTKSSDGQVSLVNEKSRDIYYNAIEKELLKAGFSVRDRGLFNEVLNKMQRDTKQNIDYSQINELTNTDLILEVIKIDPSVKYVTNKISSKDKRGNWTDKTSQTEYKRYGASAEFKIIMVKNNEMAGTYTFNYAPCTDGCEIGTFKKKPTRIVYSKNAPVIPAYEGVEVNVMEEFIEKSTQDLISAIKG